MSTVAPITHDHAHERPVDWRRWLPATNHKDIGTLYLIFSFAMFLVGGVLTPAFVGFANWMIPPRVGANVDYPPQYLW